MFCGVFDEGPTPLAETQPAEVQHILQARTWDSSRNDVWTYNWGSEKYNNKKAYNALIGFTPASPLFKWLWATSNLGNHKFFFWLLLRDRLNTKNILKRKNMHLDDYNCVLCDLNCEETCFHLFFECPFRRDCWATIPIVWDLPFGYDTYRPGRSSTTLFLEKLSLQRARLFGQQEIASSLTMGREALIFGKESLEQSLAWCVPRLRLINQFCLVYGEIITLSLFPACFFGPVAL